MLKFKSSNQSNLYIVYRLVLPFKLEKIGSVSIVPEYSYTFIPSTDDGLNAKDLSILQKRCRKLAKIEGNHFYTQIW